MYLSKTPNIVKPFFKDLVFNEDRDKKVVYVTFDDGPHPEITPWVLEVLKKHGAKATFFCVGENIEKYPETFAQLSSHSIGNHTNNHLNGWKTENETYYDNVRDCQEHTNTKLFRPPYGKITNTQAKHLISDYRIIMWDVLSGDFDQSISTEKCLSNVVNNVENGSIIVFHDSEKAETNLRYALPKSLEYLVSQGYTLAALEQ